MDVLNASILLRRSTWMWQAQQKATCILCATSTNSFLQYICMKTICNISFRTHSTNDHMNITLLGVPTNLLINGLLMKAVRQNVCINVWTTLLLWKDKTARWCRAHYWKTHKTKTDKPMKDQHETNSNDITVPIQQNLYSASKLFLSCYLSKLFLINGSMCLSLCVCGPLLCLDATEIARAIQNDVSHFLFEI